MPPHGNWPKWAKKRHAKDFTARDTVLDELRKKEHHGSTLIKRALKKAKTFDEAKLRRRMPSDEDAERLKTAVNATRGLNIDVLAKQCARACAERVEESLKGADFVPVAAAEKAAKDEETLRASRAVDLGDGFDSRDVLRGICDDASVATPASTSAKEVVGENDYVAAARRLLHSNAVRAETDALKERLLAIAARMNRAVEGKVKREQWAKEKEERAAKRAAEKARMEDRAKRRAAGEEVSSSEESESESESESDTEDASDSDSDSDDDDVDESGYLSLSEDTLAELRAAKAEAKALKKNKKSKKSRGGQAEAEDAEDLDLAPKKKKVKKRMGQRKRRQIAEAKFGSNAAHLVAERERIIAERKAKEEEERNMHPSWQAKRKQAPLIIDNNAQKGKKVKFGEDGATVQSKKKYPPSSGKAPNRPPKKIDEPEKPLHPSWQAKLKADAQAWGGGGVKPEGKKVVFD